MGPETNNRSLDGNHVRHGNELIRDAHGVGEDIDPSRKDEMVPKFFEDGLLIVRAGGPAGLFSGILTS